MTLSVFEYDRESPLHKEKFGALNREWLTRYFHVEDQDALILADPESRILDSGGVILMAATEDGIVGTGCLIPMETSVFEIAKMAVTEKFQGQGIGDTILHALIESARQMGAHRLFIVSNTSLERAIRLYRRHGFTESAENRHSHYKRGDITLERAL